MHESVVERNIKAIQAYSKETRNIAREAEKKAEQLSGLLQRIASLEEQVSLLQVKLYSGGATDGNNN